MSLLSDAKKIKVRTTIKNYDKHERSELALAWLRDEVTLKQICKAMGHKPISSTSAYLIIATGLKESYKMGLLKEVE